MILLVDDLDGDLWERLAAAGAAEATPAMGILGSAASTATPAAPIGTATKGAAVSAIAVKRPAKSWIKYHK